MIRPVATLVLCLAPCVIAQEPEGQPDKPAVSRLADIPIPTDQRGVEVLELTVLDAMRIGRTYNLDLRADALVPLESAESVRVEEALFEPEFFGKVSTGRSTSPQRNVFQPSIKRETVSGELGFRQRVVTGGSFEFTFSPSRLRQDTSTVGFPTRQFTSSFVATVTQPLLRGGWSDYALRNVDTAQAELAAARYRFERQVQQKLIDIVRAYWELAFARQDYRVVFQAGELAREQLRITVERIRLRDLPARDRISDEAEVARRREELIRAENTIAQREDELRRLLFDGQDGEMWRRSLRPTSPFEGEFLAVESDWRELATRARARRADLRALRADVRSAEIARDSAERDLLPQLDLVGSYGANGVRENFPDAFGDTTDLDYPEWSLELQLSVPVGNTAARSARDRAMLTLERTRRRLFAAELDVDNELRSAMRELRTLSESVRAARESVRLAESVLDTARETLRVGRGTLFEVQQRNQDLLDARQRLLRNQLDHHIARANLEFARGEFLLTPDEGN
ncbi:MAG: TolC family protein [Planctomycetes bacterium]|nr:TolC family protein [Planctomycetota bacterium]